MLLRSGETYSSNTVQFRFLLLQQINSELFKYHSYYWIFERILDLIRVTGIATVDQTSAQQYQKTIAPTVTNILNLINPYKKADEERSRRNAQDDIKKRNFLSMLDMENPDGFSSLADLQESLRKVKQCIIAEGK